MAQAKATNEAAVLEAAASVFGERGYRSATLDDIAARAGVSKPTLYRYAKSKRWLMDRIVKKVQSETRERSSVVWEEGLTVTERLRRLVVVNVEVAIEFKEFFAVAYAEYRESSPAAALDFNTWARETTARTRALLADAVTDGVLILDGDIGIYATLLESIFASFHRWVHADGPATPDDIADHVLRLLSAGDRERLLARSGGGAGVAGAARDA